MIVVLSMDENKFYKPFVSSKLLTYSAYSKTFITLKSRKTVVSFLWVPRQNVRRDKMSGDKTSGDITAGDITSVGQNIRRDKMSGRTKCPAGQNARRDKTSSRQNVWREKTSGDKTYFGLLSVTLNNNALLNSFPVYYSS